MSLNDRIRQNFTKLSDSIDRSRGVVPPARPAPKRTRQVVKHTRFDTQDWTEYARKNRKVDDGITDLFVGNKKDGREGYYNGPELAQDAYYSFLKAKPVLEEKRDVLKDARLNGKFIEQMHELPEYERLHDQCMTDPVLSTMATVAFMDALKDMVKQHQEAVQDSNRRREEEDGKKPEKPFDGPCGGQPGGKPGNEQGEGGGQPGGGVEESWEEPEPQQGNGGEGQGESDGDPSDPDGNTGEGSGNQEFDDEAFENGSDGQGSDAGDGDMGLDEAELQAMLDDIDFARTMNSALRDAADEMEQLATIRRGVGCEDADWKRMNPAERIALAERLKKLPNMNELADMVGRMKRFAMGQQDTKFNDKDDEIYNLEMGDNIRRVVPNELALLGHPATKYEFYRKFADKELMQYKVRGVENVGKGPIVCAIDNSGSMSGMPEKWAKAVAEALRRICKEQDRDFFAMYFGSNRDRRRYDFPKQEVNIERVLDFLSVTAGGGTEFDGVLTEALAKARDQFDQGGKSAADIVFITDGLAHLSDDWIKRFNEEKDRIGCRVFSIYIGGAYDQYEGNSGPVGFLQKFSNVVIPVSDLSIVNEATATLFSTV